MRERDSIRFSLCDLYSSLNRPMTSSLNGCPSGKPSRNIMNMFPASWNTSGIRSDQRVYKPIPLTLYRSYQPVILSTDRDIKVTGFAILRFPGLIPATIDRSYLYPIENLISIHQRIIFPEGENGDNDLENLDVRMCRARSAGDDGAWTGECDKLRAGTGSWRFAG